MTFPQTLPAAGLSETVAGGIMAHGLIWAIEQNVGMAYWNEARSLPLAAHVAGFQQNGPDPSSRPVTGYLESRSAHYGPDFMGQPHAAADTKAFPLSADGVAQFSITGPMTKQVAMSAAGTSTAHLRRIVGLAERDRDVKSGTLKIDSPGGTVAGTDDLAASLRSFAAKKPLYAFCEDLTASAGYWAASQCTRIFATPTTHIGSIGTILVIPDLSKMAEKAGIEILVFTNDGADLKGAGAPGTAITDKHKAYFRGMINGMQAHFTQAIIAGRALNEGQIRALQGRVFIADQAQQRGLIDGISSYGDVVDLAASSATSRKTFALGGLPQIFSGLSLPSLQSRPGVISEDAEGSLLAACARRGIHTEDALDQTAALAQEAQEMQSVLRSKIVTTAHQLYGPMNAARFYPELDSMGLTQLLCQAETLETAAFLAARNQSEPEERTDEAGLNASEMELSEAAQEVGRAYAARHAIL